MMPYQPNQNTEFYRFGHKLSLSPSFVQGRPLGMLSKLNPDTFIVQRLKARFGATNNLIIMNLFLPVLIQWSQIQNELIAESEKHGHINAPMTDDLRLLIGRSLPSLASAASLSFIEAGLDLMMLREDLPNFLFGGSSTEENLAWRQSVVRQSDYAVKLKSHYYANIVSKFYLPRRWTYIFVGPEASQEEVEVFSSPVSIGCAFEDHLKRYFLLNVADALTYSLSHLVMFIPFVRQMLATRQVVFSRTSSSATSSRLRHGQHRVTRQGTPSYVWKEPAKPDVKQALLAIRDRFISNGQNLLLSAVGAAVGSFLAGGHGGACEFWCGRLLPVFVSSLPSLRNWKKKVEEIQKQIEEKKNEIENQSSSNKNNTTDNDVQVRRAQQQGMEAEEEDDFDDADDQEERRRYFNQTQALFAERQAQQDNYHHQQQDVTSGGSSNQRSPVNQHRPLDHPEQRQIVLEDE